MQKVFLSHAFAAITESEPLQVAQVVSANPVPGATSFSLKTADEHYLSCDKFGCITADKIAVGPLEEWTVIKREDGFAFQVLNSIITSYIAYID
jgi:protein FRG1